MFLQNSKIFTSVVAFILYMMFVYKMFLANSFGLRNHRWLVGLLCQQDSEQQSFLHHFDKCQIKYHRLENALTWGQLWTGVTWKWWQNYWEAQPKPAKVNWKLVIYKLIKSMSVIVFEIQGKFYDHFLMINTNSKHQHCYHYRRTNH